MPENCPIFPDWDALGFPPRPEPPAQPTSFDNPFSLPPDPEYLEEMKSWVSGLTVKQRKKYDKFQHEMSAWRSQVRKELEAIQTAEYEKYGLEMGVNSEHELMVARNMAGLLNGIKRVRLAIEGQEANEQFENFFKSK